MKKFLVVFLAVALMLMPMSGFASSSGGFKSSLFDAKKEDGAAKTEAAPEVEPEGETAAQNAGNPPEAILEAVATYLDSIKWNYGVEENKIVFEMTIDSKIGTLKYELFFENGYTSYAYPSVSADSETMAEVGEFLHRANFGMRNGNFELDYNDGEIRYKSYVDCSNALPGDEVVRRSISVPAAMFEDYGDGLLQVSFGMMTPQDAIAEIEG